MTVDNRQRLNKSKGIFISIIYHRMIIFIEIVNINIVLTSFKETWMFSKLLQINSLHYNNEKIWQIKVGHTHSYMCSVVSKQIKL